LHQHTAVAGACQAGEDADQGGLAGTIGAEQSEELPLLDVQADLVECLERAFGRIKGLGNGLE